TRPDAASWPSGSNRPGEWRASSSPRATSPKPSRPRPTPDPAGQRDETVKGRPSPGRAGAGGAKKRQRGDLILLLAFSAMSLVADRPAAAQETDEPEEEAPAPPVRRRAARVSDAQIDRYVFGKDGDALTARRLCEARLKSRTAFIDQVCG